MYSAGGLEDLRPYGARSVNRWSSYNELCRIPGTKSSIASLMHSRDSVSSGRSRPVPDRYAGVGQPRGRALVILGPIVALIAAAVALGVAAIGQDGYRAETLIAATIVAFVALFLAVFLLYRQVRRRQATGRALQNIEARVTDIVESAMDPVIAVDQDQRVVLFNAAAEGMFGYPREEAIGAPLAWFIPERFRAAHASHVRGFGETGTASRRMGTLRIVIGLRRSGEEFPIDASISQVTDRGSK